MCVVLKKHIFISQRKPYLFFWALYGTRVSNAEVSQIPVEFAKLLL